MPRTDRPRSTTSVWRRKPVSDMTEESGGSGLFRTLGLWQLTAIGVGGIVGVGIFSLAGLVAHGDATTPAVGPAVVLSFLIAGLASAAAALSYAEFAGMIPRAGSAYSYGYVALGELVGWFIGWDLLLEYVAIVAVVAIGISGYLDAFLSGFGLELPTAITETADQPGGVVNIPAILICLFVTFLLSRGTRTFGRFELVAVAIKILLVVFIVVLGVFFIDPANYDPFLPNGFGPVFTGAATVFFAVFGYDAMSTAAEESKDAQRHMPKAILYSLAISMVLYVLACLTLVGIQNYTKIDPESGFSSAFASIGLDGIGTVIAVGAIVGILTVMFTFMLGVTRVWFAMSRDGLLPQWFAKTHPTRHVPTRVTWLAGILYAVIAGFMPIAEAAELTNIGILLAFVVVCIAVILLRYTRPDLPRTFRTPGMPFVPAIGVIFSLWLVTFLQWETWLRFVVWFLIGLIVYFGYSRRHSLLHPR